LEVSLLASPFTTILLTQAISLHHSAKTECKRSIFSCNCIDHTNHTAETTSHCDMLFVCFGNLSKASDFNPLATSRVFGLNYNVQSDIRPIHGCHVQKEGGFSIVAYFKFI